MIVTFTANPCVDLTFDVPDFRVNEVNRATSSQRDPAGKGINVSRALARNNQQTVAVFPGDAVNGRWIVDALDNENIETMTTAIRESVRTNVTFVDSVGHVTRVSDVGPRISTEEREDLHAQVVSALAVRPDWLVLAGTLPPGCDDDWFVVLAQAARNLGVQVAVDSSGDAMRAVASSGVADLIKPNRAELEELAQRQLPTVDDVVDFARSLLSNPGATALVSLGMNGALAVTSETALWAGQHDVTSRNTVGAGDCALAGFLSADLQCARNEIGGLEGLTVRLTTAVAWGAAKVSLSATTMPGPHDITPERVVVNEHPLGMTRIEDL